MYFDNIAKVWDNPRRIKRAEILSKLILEKLNTSNSVTALEIGCGTGLLTIELSKFFKEIFCIDNSEEMLNVLKSKIDDLKIKNIYLEDSNLIYGNSLCKKVNLIYSSMVFHHIKDTESELKKLYKLINKDGHLIIIDLDEEDGSFHEEEEGFSGHNGFDRNLLERTLKNCGFTDITFETAFQGEKSLKNKLINYSLFLCIAKKRE